MAAQRYAAAYLRRSAADDANPGIDSRDRQLNAVRGMCGDDVTVYEDWGVSGSAAKTAKRSEYQRLRGDIAAGKVASVCAESLTRLGRSTRELLSFMELCEQHDVQVQTQKERIDTSSAMGRFIFTVMAAIGELELDMGRERAKGARLARMARHEAAGALLPPIAPGKPGRLPTRRALYGFRHVREDLPGGGYVYRREHDDQHSILPLIEAYNAAGHTINGACGILADSGLPSPHGTSTWGSSTLRRILKAHRACPTTDHPRIELQDRNASGHVRRGDGRPALFRGLLRCHCGRTMTPNVKHKAYYCSAGRNQHIAKHGRFTIAERELKRALWPDAARQYRNVDLVVTEAATDELDALRARRDRTVAFGLDGLISAEQAKADVAEIDARMETIERQATSARWVTGKAINFEDPDVKGQNELLRQLWVRVQLDKDVDDNYVPHVEWLHDPDALRAADVAGEAALLDMAPEDVAALPAIVREASGSMRKYVQHVEAGGNPETGPLGLPPAVPPVPDPSENPYPARKRNRNAKTARATS